MITTKDRVYKINEEDVAPNQVVREREIVREVPELSEELLVIDNPIYVEPLFIDECKQVRRRNIKNAQKRGEIRTNKSAVNTQRKTVVADEVEFALSTKGKFMVFAYAITLFAVLFFIVSTLISISQVNLAIDGLTASIASETQKVRDLEAASNAIDNSDMYAKAEELGFGENNLSQKEIVLAGVLPETKIEEKSNWFDSFCDWLNGLTKN